MKRLSCNYARYQCESVSINTAAFGFVRDNCCGCKHHKQISMLNFVTLSKPWGWIPRLLFRTRTSVAMFIHRHNTKIIWALFGSFVLLPVLSIIFANYQSLLSVISTADQLFGLNIYDRSILATISQINATVFALAFTIPIAATQLEKYRSEIAMFRGLHLYYMLFFIFSIFFPILLPQGSNLGYVISIIVSVICLLLLIPYLKWVKESLDPEKIIETLKGLAFFAIDNHDEGEFKSTIEKLNQLIIKALSEKDYGVFGRAFEVMPNLGRHCFNKKFLITGNPSEGLIYIDREMVRIGELAIDDRTAMQIVSEKFLLLDTMHVPANESSETTFSLKVSEEASLSWLAKLAVERKNNFIAMHPISALLKTATLTVYTSDFGRKLASAFQTQIIKFLLTIPEEVVDWAYSINENEYKVKYGNSDLKIALLGMSAKFYLEYKEELKKKKKTAT
ncbi:MAG TPA: hypothetical protein VI864_04790 [Candidatus Bathyarchaeia archaeon]|nr:hypothetical protein [Candidatus Bathyarchaeia archaeon]